MTASYMPQKRRRRRDPVLIVEEPWWWWRKGRPHDGWKVSAEVREMLDFLYELELPRWLRSDIIARPNPRYL